MDPNGIALPLAPEGEGGDAPGLPESAPPALPTAAAPSTPAVVVAAADDDEVPPPPPPEEDFQPEKKKKKKLKKKRMSSRNRGASGIGRPNRGLSVQESKEVSEHDKKMKAYFDKLIAPQMWDQTDSVFDQHTRDVSKDGACMSLMFSELAKIEEQYAQALKTLAVKFQPSLDAKKKGKTRKASVFGGDTLFGGKAIIPFEHSDTMQTAWNQFCRGVHVRARNRELFAEELKKSVASKELEQCDIMLKAPATQFKLSVATSKKALDKELKTQEKALVEMRKFREQIKKKYKVSADKFTTDEDDGWKALCTTQDKKTKLAGYETKLHQALVARSMVETMYQQTVTKSLDQYQSLEFARVENLSKALLSLSTNDSNACSMIYKYSMNVVKKARAVNKRTDVAYFVKSMTSNKPCPWLEDPKARGGANEVKSPGSNRVNPFSRSNIKKFKAHANKLGKLASNVKHITALAAPVVLTPEQIQAKKDKSKRRAEAREKRMVEQKAQLEAEQKKVAEQQASIQADLKAKKTELDNKSKKLEQEQASAAAALDEKMRKLEQAAETAAAQNEAEVSAQKAELAAARAEMKAAQENLAAERAELEAAAEQLLEYEANQRVNKINSEVQLSQFCNDLGEDWDGELRTPIIIDNGEAFIKAGFAGEREPVLVIPNVLVEFPCVKSLINPTLSDSKQYLVGSAALHFASGLKRDDEKDGVRVNTQVFGNEPSSYDDLERVWKHIFAELGVDPSQHPVLLTQPTLPPLGLQKRMTEVMFENIGVGALYVCTAPLLGAYAYGSASGLVVDIGRSSAQVQPVIDGYSLDVHRQRVYHLGGKRDSERMSEYLYSHTDSALRKQLYPTEYHVDAMARHVKDTLAYCAETEHQYLDEVDVFDTVAGVLNPHTHHDDDESEDEQGLGSIAEDGEMQQSGSKGGKNVNPIEMQMKLLNCGEVLFNPKDILDDQDESIVSVPEMIKNVVSNCDLDTRTELLQNIFLSGGVTTMPGFRERLLKELKKVIPHNRGIVVYGGEESRFAVWTGGSVLCSLPSFADNWISQEDYEENGYEEPESQL